MNIDDLNRRLEKFYPIALNASIKIVQKAGVNAMSQINTRIVETGKDSKGSAFIDYSPYYKQFKTEVGRYRGHVDFTLGSYSLNKRVAAVKKRATTKVGKVKANEQAKARKEKLQKTKIREEPQMWTDIKLQNTVVDTQEVRVSIGASHPLNKKKLSKFVKKWGDILTPSQAEIERQIGYIESQIATLATQYFK